MSDKICLVDADTALYLVCHNKKDEEPKTFNDCCTQIDTLIENIMIATNSTHYILFLTIGKCFRYNITDTYKSTRKSEKPPFFKELRQYLIDEYKAEFSHNWEADDLVLTNRKLLLKQGLNCFIASPDKDIKKTFGETYDYKKLEWANTSEWEACEYFFRSMIVGDSSDGISGLKGLGEKWVDKLFEDTKDYPEKVLSNYIDYYKSVDKGIEEYYKTYKLLKIVDNIPDYEVPELQEFKRIEKKIEEDLGF